VTDDIFAEHALMGILDAGRQVPGDIDIVAHCNLPLLKPSALPIARLGFPVGQILDAAFRAIDQQRRGARPARLTTVRAVFEHEPGAGTPAAPAGQGRARTGAGTRPTPRRT
jgi:DNA-binding LacI/PurR family transcriptional regulator